MESPEPTTWTDTIDAEERVRAVVETLSEPADAGEVADMADVDREVAAEELERLRDAGVILTTDSGDQYQADSVRLFIDQILNLIEENDRSELETQLEEHERELAELESEHGAASPEEFLNEVDDDASEGEQRVARNIADTWEAVEFERRLYVHALHLYDDVTALSL